MGRRCLFVMRVSGWSRVPLPPARMTPFTAPHGTSQGGLDCGDGRGARGPARAAGPRGRGRHPAPADATAGSVHSRARPGERKAFRILPLALIAVGIAVLIVIVAAVR